MCFGWSYTHSGLSWAYLEGIFWNDGECLDEALLEFLSWTVGTYCSLDHLDKFAVNFLNRVLALDAVELSIACMATMDGSIVSTHWFECFRTWLSSSFKVTYFLGVNFKELSIYSLCHFSIVCWKIGIVVEHSCMKICGNKLLCASSASPVKDIMHKLLVRKWRYAVTCDLVECCFEFCSW